MNAPEQMTPEKADYMAAVYVNGLVDEIYSGGEVTGKRIPKSGAWAPRFQGHPYVEQAEVEGWGRDLRAAVKRATKLRIMARAAYHEIDELMPPAEWVKHQSVMAERYRKAAEYRDGVFDRATPAGIARPLGSATREAFATMQRNSPSRGMHRNLQSLAKRITGERD